jgi:hypothetical protein
MMHGSARFASWKNGELCSYLAVTLLLVWSVRHHFQHALCADSHSLALSGHSSHENLQQEYNPVKNGESECPWDVGRLQCCQHDLASISEQQWYLALCVQHSSHPSPLDILISVPPNFHLYKGIKYFISEWMNVTRHILNYVTHSHRFYRYVCDGEISLVSVFFLVCKLFCVCSYHALGGIWQYWACWHCGSGNAL